MQREDTMRYLTTEASHNGWDTLLENIKTIDHAMQALRMVSYRVVEATIDMLEAEQKVAQARVKAKFKLTQRNDFFNDGVKFRDTAEYKENSTRYDIFEYMGRDKGDEAEWQRKSMKDFERDVESATDAVEEFKKGVAFVNAKIDEFIEQGLTPSRDSHYDAHNLEHNRALIIKDMNVVLRNKVWR